MKAKKSRCKLCGKSICHWPCDNVYSKTNVERRKTCQCRFCILDRRVMKKT